MFALFAYSETVQGLFSVKANKANKGNLEEYPLEYAEGYENYTHSYFFKPVDRVVTVAFTARNLDPDSAVGIFATLPEGFRPMATQQLPATVLAGTAGVTMHINVDGAMRLFENASQRGTVNIFTANITFLTP